jgi:menaquinone-dependent protoporphyrinogen oxidase
MKYLIVYKSRHGTTRKLVKQMYEHLGKEKTSLIELGVNVVPNLEQYEIILIGGSIHAGRIQKDITRFCRKNMPVLLKKKTGLFLCFMDLKKGKQEFETAFPEELRKHSLAHGLFGGELLLEKMNFFERFITRLVSGKKQNISQIDNKAVHEFEEKIMHV